MLSDSQVTSIQAWGEVQDAVLVPAQTHEEAHALAQTEFARLLAVVEALEGEAWVQPTYCTEWTVRDLVAHIAGGAATFSSWSEFQRHYLTNPYKNDWAKPEDYCNYLQVKEREGLPAADVVREFKEKAPKELRVRYRLPWLVRKLPLPGSPPMSVGYLTDTILTRDWWIHRLDLCHATGQVMVLTPEHDGRLTSLVIRDVAKTVTRAMHGRTVELVLTGPAGGRYRFGSGGMADATIEIDALDFHLRVSGRIGVQEGLARAQIRGEATLARQVLETVTTSY